MFFLHIVFCSARIVVENTQLWKMLAETNSLSDIVVDETHCVVDWGMATYKEGAFDAFWG